MESISNALKALRFVELSLNASRVFLKFCINSYLQHESRLIKIEAILSAFFLISRLINETKNDETNLNEIIDCSLNKLFICAITDADPSVRYLVLNSLDNDRKLDYFLSLPKNFNMILRCISDECIEIRELTALFLSDLSSQNTENQTQLVPFIKEIFNEIKMEIYPDRCEKSIRLISLLISRLPNSVDFNSFELLSFFHAKFGEWQGDITLSSNILVLLGQLASRSNSDSFDFLISFLPFLIESIQDSYHLQLNQTALWTLCQIIEHTGYVIEPYKKYPNLLQTLLAILQTETSKQTRRNTIKALGLIGL